MPTEPRTQQGTAQSDEAKEPFIGRRRELKALSASLDEARSGRGRLDIVTGAPGIGKTRLTREVAAVAIQRGLRVLRGSCWEGEGAPAYWPWTDILRNAIDAALDDRAASAADFGLLLHAAATHAGVPLAAPIDVNQDAQQARFVLFDRCCEFLAATAAAQPTLVIIDDAHWADAGSLLLLQFLAGRLAELPLALLITSREPLPEMAASAGRHAWARHLALGGLSRAEAGALIEGRLARAPAPAMLDRLMRLTEGNPYFLKEIGQLLVTGEPGADTALPASLLIMVLQQYHRLSAGCRNVVQAAAVIGREFDSELVAAGSGLPLREVLPLLDEAIAQHIVTGLGAARYRFSHTLLREAIHEQLHLTLRAQLHEQILFALERRRAAGERVSSAALAHHSYMSLPLTDRHRAATHAVAAGQDAHRACAFEEAVCHFERAHDLARPTFSDSECCDVLLQLGAAQAGAGDWAHSRRTFEDAAALARRIDSPEQLARAALGFKGMMLGTIPVDVDAVALLQEALAALGDRHPGLSVELYAALSLTMYFADDVTPVHSYSDLAMDLARSLNSDRLTAVALSTRTMTQLRPSGVSVARHDADDLLQLGVRLRDPLVSFHARICRYWAMLSMGDSHRATQELSRAVDLAATTKHPRHLWQTALLNASHAIARGQLAAAPDLIRYARDLGRRVHHSSPGQHSLIQGFQLARLTKDFTTWLNAITPQSDAYPTSVGYLAVQALIHAEFGRPEEAHFALGSLRAHEFTDIREDGYYLYTLACLSDAAAASGCTTSAQALYSLLEPYKPLCIVAGWGTTMDGSVSHYLGLLARCCGHFDRARIHFEFALQTNGRLDAPPLLARTYLEYARLLAHTTDDEYRQQAHTLASTAVRIFTELGLDAYRIAAERVAADSRRGTPRSYGTEAPTHANVASTNVLIRNGDVWILRFQGPEVRLRHRIGLHYIASLLRADGDAVHVLDLTGPVGSTFSNTTTDAGDSADLTARRAYKNRLKAIEHEIDLAAEHNDLGQLARLKHERAALIRELSHSYGISGRPRPARSAAERARVSVKNRISAALAAIKPHNEAAFRHLSRSLLTGTYCRYSPSVATKWIL